MASSNPPSTQGTRIEIAVQPPVRARPNVSLYPPVAARLVSERDIYSELHNLYTYMVLIDGDTLEPIPGVNRLEGKVNDSAHPMPSAYRPISHRAYMSYTGLKISQPGKYRIRIWVGSMSETGGTARYYVDTNVIYIDANAPAIQDARPSPSEAAFLQVLKVDGQDIPAPPAA